MQQKIKKVLSTILAFVLFITVFSGNASTVNATSTVTYSTAPQIFHYVHLGNNGGELGPITITKGKLIKGSSQKVVYLVTLSGTQLIYNQATDILTDVLSGLDQDNKYYSSCVSAIQSTVPAGSNIILAGHSLGGMIAQQVAGDTTIKANYNVLNTICFGSPLVAAGKTEGTLKRLADEIDLIPFLSGNIITNTFWSLFTLIIEDGGYDDDFITAHKESYGRNDVWGKYDITGTKNGNAKLQLDLSTLSYHKAPYL